MVIEDPTLITILLSSIVGLLGMIYSFFILKQRKMKGGFYERVPGVV